MLQDDDGSESVLADHRHIHEDVTGEVWAWLLHTIDATIQPDQVPVDPTIFIELGRF